MPTIAILNQKGGVGKTSTAVNLSAALAKAGYRVGLLDLDPQAHASLHLGLNLTSGQPSTYELLTDHAELADVWQEVAPRLQVAGSHIDLAAAEVELAGVVGREVILRDKLAASQNQQNPLDYLFIDCPPSLGILTLNAMAAVEDILLPLQPHFLALHGLSKLLETIRLVKTRINDRLRLTGVVLCLFDSGTRLAAEVTADAASFFADARGKDLPWSNVHLFETRIRRNIRLAEAPSFGQSIFDYAPNSHGATDYQALSLELIDHFANRRSRAA